MAMLMPVEDHDPNLPQDRNTPPDKEKIPLTTRSLCLEMAQCGVYTQLYEQFKAQRMDQGIFKELHEALLKRAGELRLQGGGNIVRTLAQEIVLPGGGDLRKELRGAIIDFSQQHCWRFEEPLY
uniref:LisH domain-containing protein n=1 Tax=Steinernema glaseri TaxID=37863 RepID=A0A1I7ZVZ4_9BILA